MFDVFYLFFLVGRGIFTHQWNAEENPEAFKNLLFFFCKKKCELTERHS
jgi:hypothetical protein